MLLTGKRAMSSDKIKDQSLKVALNVIFYKLARGQLGGRYRGVEILLLEHIGRKSGKKRSTPVYYVREGNRYLVVASDRGADKHPGWYWNITAGNPVKIQVMGKKMRVAVTEAIGEERNKLFQYFLNLKIDNFHRYEQRTQRIIPLLILTPELHIN
jgi:deazaflavin-dependent oxidoreductase (nitroreductase family)